MNIGSKRKCNVRNYMKLYSAAVVKKKSFQKSKHSISAMLIRICSYRPNCAKKKVFDKFDKFRRFFSSFLLISAIVLKFYQLNWLNFSPSIKIFTDFF